MSSHFLTDKSLVLESRFGGWAFDGPRPFAEPGVEPHYGPDRGYRVAHTTLELDIDPEARTLRGVATLRFEALAGHGPRWELDLDELTVDGVEDPHGAPLAWTHRDGRLTVPAVAAVVVRYHGTPRRGLYFVGPDPSAPQRPPEAWTQGQDEDAHFVFPCFDHPSMLAPFTLRVTAPEGFGVVANGRLVRVEGRTWEWEQSEPIAAYLVTVVVMRMDVHPDAWDGIPVRYVVPAGTDAATVRRVFGKTPEMVRFLSERYGRYPWPRYDQVVVHEFVFGGMENVAATTLTDLVLTDERAALDWDAEHLILHELAHQWFGDLVTCQDWSQGWLNEGWATYSEHLWSTHHEGVDEGAYALFQQLGDYLAEDGGRYRRPIVTYLFREPIDVFDRHLYEKGALVLHTLRHTLGEEGFWAGVRLYLERHRHSPVHTRHFQRALEDATGRNLDRFFAEWVFGAGHPALEVTVGWADGLLSVTVKQVQEGEGVAPVFHFPIEVGFGAERRTLVVDARERTFTLPCAAQPDRVRVDGDFRLLADLKLKGPRSMLVAALKGDEGVVGRIRAARALAEEGSPEAVEALCAALVADPFWGVRAEIADKLGERGGERAAAALIGALKDPHPKARRRVVTALGAVRRPEVAAALKDHGTDPSVQVEGEIAKSLGRLRDPEARAWCERLLDRPSWGEVLRSRAAEGLGALRDRAVLPALLKLTAPELPTRARAAACAALGRLGDEVEEVRTDALERLLELAEGDNFRVQVAAINALGVLKDPRAMAVLARVHAQAGDGRCRRLAFEAMASIRAGRTTPEGLQNLRREVESLADQGRKLRDRLEKLESRP